MSKIREWLEVCRHLGGEVLKKEKQYICDFGKGKLGIKLDLDTDKVFVIDNRAHPGKNIVEMNDVEDLSVMDSTAPEMNFRSGESKIKVEREGDILKIMTEVEGEPLYQEFAMEPKKPRLSDIADYPEVEGCPAGSKEDSKTGVCIPQSKKKLDVEPSRVPLPEYSSVGWNKSSFVPLLLIDDSQMMAKATIGTWVNSGDTDIGKEFLQCKKPVIITFMIGKEYQTPTSEATAFGPDKSIEIAGTKYHRDKLYEIAEEVHGVKIMDMDLNKPLRSELGKGVKLKGLTSGKQDAPIAIRGAHDIWYLLNPMEGW